MKSYSLLLWGRKVVKIPSILLLVVSLALLSTGIKAEASGIGIDTESEVIIVVPDNPNSCIDGPVIQNISADKDKILARNNKLIPVTFSGKVDHPLGCPVQVNYKIDDSYDEMDAGGEITLDDNGNFTVVINMVASREGKDEKKEGRSYTVTFEATNKAEGVVQAPETWTETWSVTHDSRE